MSIFPVSLLARHRHALFGALPLTPLAALASVLVVSTLATGWLAACGSKDDGRPKGTGERWNVLLVTFDTTRADRIGCYGNERIETPALDGLASDGVRFARALTAVPITAPSHATILTGRYPIAHGVRDNGLFVLGDEQLTLAEILQSEGYATAAAVGAFPVTSQFGLAQGFDLYDDHLTGVYENHLGQRAVPKERLFFDERRAAQVNEALLPWLTEHVAEKTASGSRRPFFAWVHYFDPHQPFEPAPPFDQLYADRPYDGEIAYADSRLGFLLDHLEALGELDRTLVVMTADHGEGRGDHNELTHAVLAYNSTLHVPLIVRPPPGTAPAGTVVDAWVGTVDIVPTILDLLAISRPEGFQGRSLVPLWQKPEAEAPPRRYAENLSPRLAHGWGELRVLFDGSLKYIHGPRPELYDLDDDPGELHDLIDERPDDAGRLRGILQHFIERNAVAGSTTVETLDDETRRRLESLGYLHSAASAGKSVSESLTEEGLPPQDRVGDINEISAAKHLLFKGQFGDALHYTKRLVERSPDTPAFLELHANALAGAGRLDEAWDSLERLRSQGATSDDLLFRLTRLRFEAGQQRSALETLREHVERSPSAPGWWLIAKFHHRLGESDAGRAALEEALAVDRDFAPAHLDLGLHLARAGDLAAAELELEKALENNPYDPRTFYNYGTLLLHAGRYGEAAGRFRRAIALRPGYVEAYHALVVAQLEAGSLDQARETRQALIDLAPDSAQAQEALKLDLGS